MRQVFSNVFVLFLFYLEIVNKMRQVLITISEFTHRIKQPCGSAILSLYDSLKSSVFKLSYIFIEK